MADVKDYRYKTKGKMREKPHAFASVQKRTKPPACSKRGIKKKKKNDARGREGKTHLV